MHQQTPAQLPPKPTAHNSPKKKQTNPTRKKHKKKAKQNNGSQIETRWKLHRMRKSKRKKKLPNEAPDKNLNGRNQKTTKTEKKNQKNSGELTSNYKNQHLKKHATTIHHTPEKKTKLKNPLNGNKTRTKKKRKATTNRQKKKI